jgi:hypothetical protein
MNTDLKFIVDENLGPPIAHGMAGFKEPIVHVADCEDLGKGVQDPTLLEYIGRKGWFLLTIDKKISKNPEEKHSFRKHKIGAFFLGGDHRSNCFRIQQLVRNWPKIKELAAKTTRPFVYRVRPTGTKIERKNI